MFQDAPSQQYSSTEWWFLRSVHALSHKRTQETNPLLPEISGQTEIIYLQGGYTQNKILKWSHTRLSCVL